MHELRMATALRLKHVMAASKMIRGTEAVVVPSQVFLLASQS